jgi:hypothetical protein
MSHRQNLPVLVRDFSPEDQEKFLEESILEWRALGAPAAWKAIYDLLGLWFAARGLDRGVQRVDRSHIEIYPVPCSSNYAMTEARDPASAAMPESLTHT